MKKNISFLWMLTVVISSVLVAACSSSDDYQEPKPATSSMTVKVTLGTGEFDPLKVFDITAHVIDEKGKETAIPITEQDWTMSISAGLPSTMSAYLTFEKKSTLPQGMTTFCYNIKADYSFFGQLDNDNKGVYKWNSKIDNAMTLDVSIEDIDNQLEYIRSRFKGATATVTAEQDSTVTIKDYLQ
jgi:hypothetical protein